MKPKYFRRKASLGHFDDEGKLVITQNFKSINAAKKASRELQGKALGQGILTVIRDF